MEDKNILIIAIAIIIGCAIIAGGLYLGMSSFNNTSQNVTQPVNNTTSNVTNNTTTVASSSSNGNGASSSSHVSNSKSSGSSSSSSDSSVNDYPNDKYDGVPLSEVPDGESGLPNDVKNVYGSDVPWANN